MCGEFMRSMVVEFMRGCSDFTLDFIVRTQLKVSAIKRKSRTSRELFHGVMICVIPRFQEASIEREIVFELRSIAFWQGIRQE